MPHKRQKKSVRDAEKAKKGFSLPPTKADEMPRGAMRILNAGKVQAAFRASGRKTSEDTGERQPQSKGKASSTSSKKRSLADDSEPAPKKAKVDLPKIFPHESLGEYNRRIEALLRPGVSGAIKKAEAARGAQKKRAEDEKKERIARAQGKALPEKKEAVEEEESFKPNKPVKEFKEVERRRLNDIAQAPPSLPRLKMAEKAEKKGKLVKNGRDPLNAGQRRIMEEERERVIEMYRDMKAKKEAARAK